MANNLIQIKKLDFLPSETAYKFILTKLKLLTFSNQIKELK